MVSLLFIVMVLLLFCSGFVVLLSLFYCCGFIGYCCVMLLWLLSMGFCCCLVVLVVLLFFGYGCFVVCFIADVVVFFVGLFVVLLWLL